MYQCDRQAVIPEVSDSAAYHSALEQVISAHELDALIPGSDPELLPIATFKEKCLSLGCHPISSTSGFVRIARDKHLSYCTLSLAGIPFVRTFSLSDFLRTLSPGSFPALVKPRDGSASLGAKVLFGPQDVLVERTSDDYVVQDYLIPTAWDVGAVGPADVVKQGRLRQEDEVSLQGVVSPDGTVVSVFAGLHELWDGVPTKVVPTRAPELCGFARCTFTVFSRLGHVGPINVQGRLTGRGLVLYEINPRFTGVTAVRAELGFNECEAALRLFVSGEDPHDVAARLHYTTDTVCLRYVTEQMVPRSQVLLTSESLVRDSPRATESSSTLSRRAGASDARRPRSVAKLHG